MYQYSVANFAAFTSTEQRCHNQTQHIVDSRSKTAVRRSTRTKWTNVVITTVLPTDSGSRLKSRLLVRAELCWKSFKYTFGLTLWKVAQIIVLRRDLKQPAKRHPILVIYTTLCIHAHGCCSQLQSSQPVAATAIRTWVGSGGVL